MSIPFVSNETPEAPAKEEVTILSSSLKSYPAPIVAVSLESEVILYSKSAPKFPKNSAEVNLSE
ncbi:hypothetical protein N5T78_09565 [Aliarcobacter cryaerophilus]|nr:hypothetical protein [Aliarcobacter cryaerophilus]MCT7466827.1 hypothetical protein [Aliarcobacter cryaerophilus]